MQTVLHVSESATQQITENVNDIVSFSNLHIVTVIEDILKKHNCNVNQSVLKEILGIIHKVSPLNCKSGPFSTNHRTLM